MKKLEEILDILVCPSTGQKLSIAASEQIDAVNKNISNGQAKTVAGQIVSELLTQGLITEDHSRIYPIQNQIATLLPNDAIILE